MDITSLPGHLYLVSFLVAGRGHTSEIWATPLKISGQTYSCQSARGPCTFNNWTYYDDSPFQWQDWMASELTIPNWQGTVAYNVMGTHSGQAGVLKLLISSNPNVAQGPLIPSNSGFNGNGLCISSCLAS